MIEIMEKGVAVLVSIIPQGDEDTIPECNSDCGKDGISRKRLFGRTGDKSDVCAAKWNYAGEADCDFPVVAKSTVGGKDGLFGRRKSPHQSVEKWGAAEASDQIGKGSSDKSGDAAIYNKKKQRRTMTGTEGSGKGQDKLAGNGKTGVFQRNEYNNSRCSIVLYPKKNLIHKITLVRVLIHYMGETQLIDFLFAQKEKMEYTESARAMERKAAERVQTLQSRVTLNNGVEMPIFGLGVYKSEGDTVPAVQAAIKNGYRLIDTAAFYFNEKEVGEAVRTCGVPREELFITTKLWNDKQREGRQREAFEASLKELGLEYVDLYLIHWPVPEKIHETWKILEGLYEEGIVKAIGVSNFLEHHLEKLSVKANIAPAVDQFECNPYLTRQSLRQYCRKHDIVPEAWSPLGRGACFEDPVLLQIAKRHGKSVAQVILRYDVQNGIITIPKSTKEERIIQNAQVFDFVLTEEEIAAIDGLNRDEMHGDPDHVNF